MSSPRYVGRHGSRRPSPLSRLGSLPSSVGSHGARTVAKSVAGVGIVLGSGAFVIAPSQAEGNPAPVADSVATAQTSVEDLFSDRTGDGSASRSSARVAAAITAPDGKQAEDVHDGAGALAVEPVVKPKPKPKPKPTPKPEPVEQTEEETEAPARQEQADGQEQTAEAPQAESTTSSTTAAAPATDNYASQAAALGLGANAQKVYSAVRTQFPDMTNIGGYRAGDPGDHGTGSAVDIMVSGARGEQVAAWVRANAGSLNVKYVIYQQQILFPNGTSKMMEDRGDPTQNHFDHVHVSVN